jgi:hypothetical protein
MVATQVTADNKLQAGPSCGNIGYYMNLLGGEVGEGDVVVPNSPQTGQDLRERCDNEVLGMPAKKFL